jgi:predicted  nucleic acid-binding Zn-ribbon protein
MENQKYITDLHQEHQDWEKKLAFYEDEIKIMKNRLSEVSAKNTDSAIKIKVEQYQNRFIIQKNEIDQLKHAIGKEESELTANLKENPVAYTHRKLDDNIELRGKIEIFDPIFESLKADFNQFIAENL